MKRKFLILMGVVGCLILVLQSGALSADKTFFIKGDNIKSLGNPLTVGNDNILFYKNGQSMNLYIPNTNTIIDDFNINNGSVDDKGSGKGRNVQIDCNVGDVLTAVIWRPNVGQDNYYGKKTLTMSQANFDDSALTWNWNNLAVDYKAASPYKPIVSEFSESTTSYTDGSPSSSVLTVKSVNGSGNDGLREVNSFAWKMWIEGEAEPADALSNATSRDLSLDSDQLVAGVTYAFKSGHENQWGGPTWSDKYTHTVSGAPGPALPFTFDLQPSSEEKLVVNSIAIPHNLGITKASELVALINEKAKADKERDITEDVVIVLGRWDPVAGKAIGYYPETEKVEFDLVPGEGYQVYVTQGFRLVLP